MYANAKADKILEDMRKTKDEDARKKNYELFNAEIEKDIPAVFLYTPDFIYAVPDKLKGVRLDKIVTPSDRFSNIYEWFVKTDKVWEIFAKDKTTN
jgi:peptide/nickel transport system substrate-binding protein